MIDLKNVHNERNDDDDDDNDEESEDGDDEEEEKEEYNSFKSPATKANFLVLSEHNAIAESTITLASHFSAKWIVENEK